MYRIMKCWKDLKLLPSAWLLCLQLFILVLSAIDSNDTSFRAVSWMLGVLVLLFIAKIIRYTATFTALGLIFVGGAFFFSLCILLGYHSNKIQILAHSFEALAYFYAAYGLLRYMFADHYLTKDELFAAGAVFTLIAWGFAFLYSICQLLVPASFVQSNVADVQSWFNLLYLSFSVQSATGLSDIVPTSSPARALAMVQMFCGVMYIAIIVSRLISMHCVRYLPHDSDSKNK